MSHVTFIAGIPGTGKTATLIDLLQREVLAHGRPVFIDQRVNPTTGELGPSIPGLGIQHQMIEDAKRWHEPGVLPDGACLVVDEAQDLWPVAPNGSKVPPELMAMNRVRHRGITIYLASQRPAMIHSHIRGLVGRYVLLRNLGVLGRRWHEWTEFPESPLAFKSALQSKSYRLPKHVFGLYKSSSLHVKTTTLIPRAVWALVFLVPLLVGLVWYAAVSITGKTKAKDKPEAPAAGLVAAGPFAAPGGPSRAVPGRALAVSAPVKDREPYAGLGLHLAGTWRVADKLRATFTASVDGQAVATVTDTELQRAGYGWRVLGPCSAVLIFGERERFVTCDVPRQLPARPQAAPAAPAGAASAAV